VLAAAAFFAIGAGGTLGTHTENCDGLGCDTNVTDFIPTDAQRQQKSFDTFLLIAPAALIGVWVGARGSQARTLRMPPVLKTTVTESSTPGHLRLLAAGPPSPATGRKSEHH
jgi:hypothetical protein